MQQPSKSKLITILIHVLAWSVFGLAIFFYLPFFSGIDIHYAFWTKQAATLGLLIIAFYFNSYVLVPRFLLKNRMVSYLAIITGTIIATVAFVGWSEPALNLQRTWFNEAFLKRVMKQILAHRGENILEIFTLVISVLVLGISTSLATIQKWQKDRQRREQLEKDNISSELSFLKAQINPHFFFNTLNNIYVLTAVDANLAGEAIHQLSRMMRYLLYETHQGQTRLSREIAFVKDYLSLMQLRLTEAVTVTLYTPSPLQDISMAPMLLLPFLENAFKHGVSITQQSQIDIRIDQSGNELKLTVKNSIVKADIAGLDINQGIGLVNTRRRLELLYPKKHTLEIFEHNADHEYAVYLTLQTT